MIFDDSAGWVTLSSKASGPGQFNVEISCGALEWQPFGMVQVCNLSLPPLSTVEDLYISENLNAGTRLKWDYPIGSEEWLDLLKPFTSVKNLYLSDDLRQRIAPALRLLVGDRVTEVLPNLETIFLEGPPSGPYIGIRQFISPALPPNSYSYSSWLRPSDPSWLDHEQDFTAPPPNPQPDWQNFSLDGPQPSGPFQEGIWQFISPQQPDPQNLHLDYIQPSGPSDGYSEQHSSAQLATLYNLYSEQSQTSRPFQEGGLSDPQNVHLDWLQPSEPFHGDSEQHSSAQSHTSQNLYSVESQPSRPFQEGDWPGLQDLHLNWSLPSELLHEDSQYSSAQLSAMQNLDWEISQPPRPLQEGCWPDPQNFHLDGSRPSEPEEWEECIGQFAAARQKTTHPITISFRERKYERVKR
ncbi:hypothetical protein F5888DRAFT_1665480 [Russula emetica]|nr:hypothetical protein F5888DRAFT_1665480 [Russula emetica]